MSFFLLELLQLLQLLQAWPARWNNRCLLFSNETLASGGLEIEAFGHAMPATPGGYGPLQFQSPTAAE